MPVESLAVARPRWIQFHCTKQTGTRSRGRVAIPFHDPQQTQDCICCALPSGEPPKVGEERQQWQPATSLLSVTSWPQPVREGFNFMTLSRQHTRYLIASLFERASPAATRGPPSCGLRHIWRMSMSKTPQHPLEHSGTAQSYFERLEARASKGAVAVWREAVEACTGSLPSWAARKYRARVKA